LATVKDAVNCCVATLPKEVVETAEMGVAVAETFALDAVAAVETTATVSVLD